MRTLLRWLRKMLAALPAPQLAAKLACLLAAPLVLAACTSAPPILPEAMLPACAAYAIQCEREPQQLAGIDLPRQCSWSCSVQ